MFETSFVDSQEAVTKTAQVLVKDVKMLLDAMSKDRDTLTEAAQEIANTVSRLSDEVKLAAASLTSDNQTGQVRTFRGNNCFRRCLFE